MEKTKKKKAGKEVGEHPDPLMKEQEKLNKKVTHLMKTQKLRAVRQIVEGQDDSKPWDQNAKAKVYIASGSHWELLLFLMPSKSVPYLL